MKRTIKYCPNCSMEMSENKRLAQGVSECIHCDTRYYILITSCNNRGSRSIIGPLNLEEQIERQCIEILSTSVKYGKFYGAMSQETNDRFVESYYSTSNVPKEDRTISEFHSQYGMVKIEIDSSVEFGKIIVKKR